MNCLFFTLFFLAWVPSPGSSRRPGWSPPPLDRAQLSLPGLVSNAPCLPSQKLTVKVPPRRHDLSSHCHTGRPPAVHRQPPACPVVTSSQHHDRVTVNLARDEDVLLVSYVGGPRVQTRAQKGGEARLRAWSVSLSCPGLSRCQETGRKRRLKNHRSQVPTSVTNSAFKEEKVQLPLCKTRERSCSCTACPRAWTT